MARHWLILTLAIFAGSAMQRARAQSNTSAPTFEVASVKPDTSGKGMSIAFTPGRLTARAVTLKILILNAYNVSGFQVQGGPGWIDSDHFDVDAKWTEGANPKQAPDMLQALLAERFQLKVHRETHEQAIYTLIVAKNGPQLTPAKDDERPSIRGLGRGRMQFQKASMLTLAENLAGNLNRTVIDKTGLSGNFDFTLEWAADLSQPDPEQRASIFTAVQEQLGLRLESDKGPVEMLIIDSVQKPAEN
jgi:uncharacterized protein (TIGR03435 family)